MDWPIPEFNEAQVREKEREAAKYGKYALAAVAKMYQRLGKPQQAIDCYKLAKRPTKVRRVEGEKVYNIKETLSICSLLEVPEWYCVGRGYSQKEVDFVAELYATLGDPYLAIITYLESGMEAPFDYWLHRDKEQKTTEWDATSWFVKPPAMSPTLGKCGWNAEWAADLAERDGKPEIAATIRKIISDRSRHYQDAYDDGEDVEVDSLRDAERSLESGLVTVAVSKYKEWHSHRQCSWSKDWGLLLAPPLFYTAGDMTAMLDALKEWRRYADEHPDKARSHVATVNNLSRLEVLALWRLGQIEDAAVCFENFVRETSNRRDWEKERCYGLGCIYYDIYQYTNDLSALATLWELACNEAKRDEILQTYELVTRSQGYWSSPVIEYYFRKMYDKMERVCREEDELDVAAYLYERADKIDDAARIYEDISGKSGTENVTDESTIVEKDTASDERQLKKCACGEALQPYWKVCPACGKKLDMVCSCGEPLKEGWKLCPACGKEIAE